jgi:hypothetical protein
MATYRQLLTSVDKIFASSDWQGQGISAYPANYWPQTNPDEFVIYEIIPSSIALQEYQKPQYKGGLIILQIYTRANQGLARTTEIADILNDLFERNMTDNTQLYDGVLSVKGIDKDDTSLFRADYSLQFNSF